MKSVKVAIYGSQDDVFELCIYLRKYYEYNLQVTYYSEKCDINNIFDNKYDVVLINDYTNHETIFKDINKSICYRMNGSKEKLVSNIYNNMKVIGFPKMQLYNIITDCCFQTALRLKFISDVINE